MTTNFCDYCKCIDCQTGYSHDSETKEVLGKLLHAKTKDNKYICDICYNYYDGCISATGDVCANKNCQHRPILITHFIE